jgi:hypothetical protein
MLLIAPMLTTESLDNSAIELLPNPLHWVDQPGLGYGQPYPLLDTAATHASRRDDGVFLQLRDQPGRYEFFTGLCHATDVRFMILPVQFFNRRHHVLGIDSLLAVSESTQKSGITQHVDQSGYATGVTVNGRERIIRNQVIVPTARNL